MDMIGCIWQKTCGFFDRTVGSVLRHLGIMKELEATPEEIEELYEFIEFYGKVREGWTKDAQDK